jgi:hypothetical protein
VGLATGDSFSAGYVCQPALVLAFHKRKNPLESPNDMAAWGASQSPHWTFARRGFTNFRTELDGKLPNRPCSVSVRLYRQVFQNAREKIYFFAGREKLPEKSGEFVQKNLLNDDPNSKIRRSHLGIRRGQAALA